MSDSRLTSAEGMELEACDDEQNFWEQVKTFENIKPFPDFWDELGDIQPSHQNHQALWDDENIDAIIAKQAEDMEMDVKNFTQPVTSIYQNHMMYFPLKAKMQRIELQAEDKSTYTFRK